MSGGGAQSPARGSLQSPARGALRALPVPRVYVPGITVIPGTRARQALVRIIPQMIPGESLTLPALSEGLEATDDGRTVAVLQRVLRLHAHGRRAAAVTACKSFHLDHDGGLGFAGLHGEQDCAWRR